MRRIIMISQGTRTDQTKATPAFPQEPVFPTALPQKLYALTRRRDRLTRAMLVVFVIALTLVASPRGARAQLSTATLFGTITDSSGALVPSATIVATQTDTNFTRTITTKSDGSYRDEFLPI